MKRKGAKIILWQQWHKETTTLYGKEETLYEAVHDTVCLIPFTVHILSNISPYMFVLRHVLVMLLVMLSK